MIITISRGSYSHGKEIAEKVAEKLGYECIARKALLEASEEYNIPEVKLERAIKEAPSVLDRFVGGKQRYIAYIKAALTCHVRAGNVVYHGLAGHWFLEGISHVLKVRVNACMEDRARIVMGRDKISREEAIAAVKDADQERYNWSMSLHGVDHNDSHLYDLVLHLRRIPMDFAVDMICDLSQSKHFQVTDESRQVMEDVALAANVRCHLIGLKPDIEVTAREGVVHVNTAAYPMYKDTLTREIRGLAMQVEGVKKVEVELESTPRWS